MRIAQSAALGSLHRRLPVSALRHKNIIGFIQSRRLGQRQFSDLFCQNIRTANGKADLIIHQHCRYSQRHGKSAAQLLRQSAQFHYAPRIAQRFQQQPESRLHIVNKIKLISFLHRPYS